MFTQTDTFLPYFFAWHMNGNKINNATTYSALSIKQKSLPISIPPPNPKDSIIADWFERAEN